MNRRVLVTFGLVLVFQAACCLIAEAQVRIPTNPGAGRVYAPPVPVMPPTISSPTLGGSPTGISLKPGLPVVSTPRLSPGTVPAQGYRDEQTYSPSYSDPSPAEDGPEEEPESEWEADPPAPVVIDPPPPEPAQPLPDAEADDDEEEGGFPWLIALGAVLVGVLLLGLWRSRD